MDALALVLFLLTVFALVAAVVSGVAFAVFSLLRWLYQLIAGKRPPRTEVSTVEARGWYRAAIAEETRDDPWSVGLGLGDDVVVSAGGRHVTLSLGVCAVDLALRVQRRTWLDRVLRALGASADLGTNDPALDARFTVCAAPADLAARIVSPVVRDALLALPTRGRLPSFHCEHRAGRVRVSIAWRGALPAATARLAVRALVRAPRNCHALREGCGSVLPSPFRAPETALAVDPERRLAAQAVLRRADLRRQVVLGVTGILLALGAGAAVLAIALRGA